MEHKLEDICNFYNGGAWSESEYVESGIPVVKVSNIKGNDIVFDNINYISESSLKKYQKNILKTDDVVIATVGSHPSLESSAAGRSVIIPKKIDGYLLNQNAVCLRTKNNDILNQKYLGYLAETQAFRNFIQNRGGGAANQMRIPIGAIKSYKFKIPKEQNKIVKILSNYDDLIENNLKQIKLLEEKARLTYEEWFLRFRIDGKKLEIDEETELPFGWEKKNLFDIADVRYGYPFKAEQFNNEANGTPIIRIRNIPSSSTSDYTTEIVDEKYLVKKGDLLIGMDGEFHINHWSGEEGYLVQRVCSIKTKESNLFGYFSEAIKPKIKYYEETISGATVAHLGKKHLEKIEIVVPTNDITQKLEIFNSLLKQKINLATQNNLLKESRNILLPRLMTGIIDVDKLDIEV